MSAKGTRWWISLLALLALLVLAGCQAAPAAPAAPAAQSGAATAASAEATAASTEAAAAAPAGDQKVFRIWWYEPADNAMGIAWDDALKDFQAAHPDVKVEFELKTFEQMVQTGKMVLNSQDVPDVLEINKGNATAGLYAKEGLLTNLDEVAKQRGWDTLLSPSIQTTARYNDQGIMGTGSLFGIPNYGEYVMVYYNKDMFDKYGLKVPTSLDEFNAVADKFVAEGITPLALGAASGWPATHNWQELLLYKADRNLINNFQFLTGDVDFQGEAFTYGAQAFQEQVKKGYYGDNSTGATNDDANASFVQGKVPMVLTGSWAFGGFMNQVKDFDWGIFIMPGKKLNTGSGGNMWVVPTNAKNKDLAYDFIDLTLAKKSQTLMANSGGIPINADLEQITDPKIKELNANFATIVKNDGLAFYPDWPVPGYMDTLSAGLQELIGGTMTPQQFNDSIAGPYNEYKATLK